MAVRAAVGRRAGAAGGTDADREPRPRAARRRRGTLRRVVGHRAAPPVDAAKACRCSDCRTCASSRASWRSPPGCRCLTGVLFGFLPAWHLASQDVNASLKDGGRSPGGVRRTLRVALVVSEIALASLLLVAAGLTLRSFQSVLNLPPGFQTKGILTASVALPASRYREDPSLLAAFDQIEEKLRSLPGVRAVGATTHLPLERARQPARRRHRRARADAGHADARASARRHARLLPGDRHHAARRPAVHGRGLRRPRRKSRSSTTRWRGATGRARRRSASASGSAAPTTGSTSSASSPTSSTGASRRR